MIKVVDKKYNVIGKFSNYKNFDIWLMGSDFAVEGGDSLSQLKREGGMVIVEPLTSDYLKKVLYIK